MKAWHYRVFSNVSYLSAGSFLSQAIGFIGLAYIARMLGPEAYGTYLTVTAFVAFFVILTLTDINKVIIREGSKDTVQMIKLYEGLSGLKCLLGFVAIIACIIFSQFTPYSTTTKFYIIIFSSNLFYHSLFHFVNTAYIVTEKMIFISIFAIVNRIVHVSLSILALYLGYGIQTLLFISLFIHFSILIISYYKSQSFFEYRFWTKIQIDKKLLKQAITFSLLGFSVALTTRIDILMISLMSNPINVGIYGAAFKITQFGVVIRNIIATASFPFFVRRFSNKKIKWSTVLMYAFGIGFVILISVSLFHFVAEDILVFLFGEEYRESGRILSLLIFHLAFLFFNIPFTNILQSTYNEVLMLKYSLIGPVCNIFLNIYCFELFGLVGFAYSTIITTVIMTLIYVFLSHRVLANQKMLL